MVTLQVVSNSSVSFVRAFQVDLLYLISDFLICFFIRGVPSMYPLIISCSTYFPNFTERIDGTVMLFVFFFDCLIDQFMSDQTQPRLLSISLSFFKKAASISACSFSALRILFSARSRSNSVISLAGFERPRLS